MDFLRFALIMISMIGISVQQDCCPGNYELHVTQTIAICIRMVTNSATSFDNALAECQMVNRGSLLKLDPLSELQAVVPVDDTNYWIGLRRQDEQSPLLWTADNTEPSGSNWADGQPADTRHCVQLSGNANEWRTVGCGGSVNYICQAEVNCAVPSCLNAVTQARCPCNIGFSQDGDTCKDINECDTNTSPCGEMDLVRCVNTPGSYECACVSGASRNGDDVCTLDQECAVDTDCTGVNMACERSFDGVLRCQCATGYEGNPCSNINECACDSVFAQCVNGQKCVGENEVCEDLTPSFRCNCAPGFTRQPNNFCIDTDECSEGICNGERQTCTNTQGGYTCICDDGYELEGVVCVESCRNRCDPISEMCNMEQQGPVCSCNIGFFDDQGICRDVNECGLSTTCDSMGDNMACVNTVGSFSCQCRQGFIANDDRECVDVDECVTGDHDCQTVDECTDTVGSFTCACESNEVLINGQCQVVRSFRVKIVAAELNDTQTPYNALLNSIYEYHFCTTALNILNETFPTIPYDCSILRFESGSVRGYVLVRMLSSTILDAALENALERNVVSDVSGKQRLLSGDRALTMTLVNPILDIDVQDVSTYLAPCTPNPCQNGAPCTDDADVYDVDCLCPTGVTGELCQNNDDVIVPVTQAPTTVASSSDNDNLVIIIIACGVGALVVILFLGCSCCVCFYCLQNGGGFGGPSAGGPIYGGPVAHGPGVAPIEGPPSIAGYGRGGYYDTNSVI